MMESQLKEELFNDEYSEEQEQEGVVRFVQPIDALPENEKIFKDYGTEFQESLMRVLLHDREWALEASELMNPNMFESRHVQFVGELYWKFFKKYRAFPTMSIFVNDIVKQELKGMDDSLRNSVTNLLIKCSKKPEKSEAEYIKDKMEKFCRNRNIKNALVEAVSLVKEEKYDAIIGLLNKAVSQSSSGGKGHDFHSEREARWLGIERNPIPTGIQLLDDETLQGGLSAGELGVVVAATGVGKSHFLVHVGAEAILAGYNVLHYTFELNEYAIGRRYDSHMTEIPSNEILQRTGEVRRFYKEKNLNEIGNLFIKEFGTGTASVITLKAHIDKLGAFGFYPDLIVIDYADIMKSTNSATSFQGTRFEQKSIYEELRALSKEVKAPIWTASQANREGAAADYLTSEHMGEAYGKAQISDVVIGLTRKVEDKISGRGNLFIAKNRINSDGYGIQVNVCTATSTFRQSNSAIMSPGDIKQGNKETRAKLSKELMESLESKFSKIDEGLNNL